MPNKKVLIITYYWPPSGGVSVQRWLKFSKHLKSFGWDPIIYTVSNGDYMIDNSLLNAVPKDIEVIKRPIWEPHHLYRYFSPGSEKDSKKNKRIEIDTASQSGFFQKMAIWIRANLFIPDARKFWISPSVRFLKNYLKRNRVDAIISTGPPHSLHIIGLRISRYFELPWVADFRDPWTSMDYYLDFKLSSWGDQRHRQLEKKVITSADKVIVVGNSMKYEFEAKGSKNVVLLPNGFDENDFKLNGNVVMDEKFSLLHTGTFLPRRDPIVLWKAISELREENHPLLTDLEIKLIGNVNEKIISSIESFGFNQYVNIIKQKPFKEVVIDMHSAQILLLPIDWFEGSKWVITGKLFEYLAVRRPILCVGPKDGDAAYIIDNTKSGVVIDFEDVKTMKEQLIGWYQDFKNKQLSVKSEGIESYSTKQLTAKLADILNEISL
jgi:glycosyltransferase involved in cell wall biosynthesis